MFLTLRHCVLLEKLLEKMKMSRADLLLVEAVNYWIVCLKKLELGEMFVYVFFLGFIYGGETEGRYGTDSFI